MNTEKKWVKNCPNCGGEQEYSSYDSFRNAKRKNTRCNKCSGVSKQRYPKKERICPQCGLTIHYKSRRGYVLALRNNTWCLTCSGRRNMETQDKSFFLCPEYRKKLSDGTKIRRKDPLKYGIAFREKCRKNRALQLQRGVTGEVNYNPKACIFIDRLNREMDWNLVHALNGGERMVEGFFLDGYDETRNIVFEYDEPKHHTSQQSRKDRMKEAVIRRTLNPKLFLRYDEKNGVYVDVTQRRFLLQSL